MGDKLDHIRSYYAALNTGDPDEVARHFTDDAVHYYTRLGPHEGARTIGEHTKWAVENLDGQWHLYNGIEEVTRL
jgi:ketosteroid isomerase-like protein